MYLIPVSLVLFVSIFFVPSSSFSLGGSPLGFRRQSRRSSSVLFVGDDARAKKEYSRLEKALLGVDVEGEKKKRAELIAQAIPEDEFSEEEWVKQKTAEHKLIIFAKTGYPICQRAFNLLVGSGAKKVPSFKIIEYNEPPLTRTQARKLDKYFEGITGNQLPPHIFANGEKFGTGRVQYLEELHKEKKLKDAVKALI
uniref:Uncharacterized protein n=1 Tax=Chromera velia CCMP2878 TaxID=1169474 RepID=A0A0G4H8D0_9ALVE|eukprot:Cvel_25072.t1-p1 / transcript=Cvel_25072.t1 / gene=Cvel_25072 / organism=Chromera_velia_CCMP2878 / gene_product=hypothetical protein / transcript_product=hypothetical protein / location=Cvel_scaffold2790:9847-12703(+) / protein_length=196 / sequence_SO=supercontig / SO=protein_coding / is_pseudo=false